MPGLNYTKTRIAPTPSGFLHLGNVLSFAVTVSLARDSGANVLLRIDDLDQARVDDIYLQDIFDTLNFLEIPWAEGPLNLNDFRQNYSQLRRMELYRSALDQLAKQNLVFACNCSRKAFSNNEACLCINKKISLNTENTSWRFITKHIEIPVKNYKGDFINGMLPADMQNFVVKKKDGFPAYQLTSLIDDLFFGADFIVRGQDLWPSTIAQQLLASALGKDDFNQIAFHHHPLLMDELGNKLSKSKGATSIKHLCESGKKPSDIFNAIGGMLGAQETISNWQTLAKLVI